jgi:sialic acid synthase SpsE
MRIGSVDLDEHVLVIAEIGNNHEGDPAVAERMVREAAAAGADAVKLQVFRTELFTSPDDAARFERLRSFELSREAVLRLHDVAREVGVLFIATPLDLDSAAFLEPLVDAFKIASSDNLFFPLLEAAAGSGKPVVVSVGLSDAERAERSVSFLRRHGADGRLLVLHCTTSYPAAPEHANLASIGYLRDRLACPVGYSDHTLGTEVCELAVAAGAEALEKHFTLDKQTSDFRDHQLAADPPELRRLVERVRAIEIVRGRSGKPVHPEEEALADAVGRSIVARRDLPPQTELTWSDLAWTRPAGGLAPGDEDRVLGRRLAVARRQGERILPGDVV